MTSSFIIGNDGSLKCGEHLFGKQTWIIFCLKRLSIRNSSLNIAGLGMRFKFICMGLYRLSVDAHIAIMASGLNIYSFILTSIDFYITNTL